MALSQLSKKSLEENEETFKSNLLLIEKSLGVEFQVEFDFEDIVKKCNDSWVTNNCGTIFYKDVTGNLVKSMESVGKNENTKKLFLEAVPSNKISVIVVEDKNELDSHWKYQFEHGKLELLFRPEIRNTSEINTYELSNLIPVPSKYSLATRLNIKENEIKLKDTLDNIKKLLNSNDYWSLDEPSLSIIYSKLIIEQNTTSATQLKEDKFGNFILSMVEKVYENLKKHCCSDTMILEAVQEATFKNQIVFKNDPYLKSNCKWSFNHGSIIITIKSISNISEILNFDFIKLL